MMRKYLGGGFVYGVPARDLTEEEQAQFAGLIASQEDLTGVRLYEPVKKTVKKTKENERNSE